MRNTDIVADVVKAFFAAKRRYGRDLERWEVKWEWFALCDNYCKRYGHNDDNLIKSLFSSYSWAERRIYNKIVEGKVLADTSKSLFEIMKTTKEDMLKKEMEKKRKEEEKKREEAEKEQRKAERARKAEEKKKQEEEKKKQREEQRARKAEEKKLNAKKSKKMEAVGVRGEQDDDREPDVDPDFPKAEDWWTGPVAPWSKEPDILEDIKRPRLKKNSHKPKKKWDDDAQGVIEFPE